MDLKTSAALAVDRPLRYCTRVAQAEEARRQHAEIIKHHVFENVRKLRPLKKNDIVCIMVGRNEMLRLPDALRHYRALGVDRFAFIDNLSDDGTREYLMEQPDVDVVATGNSYAEAHSAVYWFEKISLSYGWGRWNVLVDPDELLVYDGMHSHDLHDLTRVLEKRRALAMTAPLVDMYSDAEINHVVYESGQPMIECCRYFDGDLKWTNGPNGERYFSGGPRRRLLSRPGQPFKHSLMKHPVYRTDRRIIRESIHQIDPRPHRRVPTGALLHFKFLSDFSDRVQRAIEHGQHYQGGIEYKRYAEGLTDGTLLTMMYENSRRLDTLDDLLKAGNPKTYQLERPRKEKYSSSPSLSVFSARNKGR